MTNKYSGLSDFEVNLVVFYKLQPNNKYQFNAYPDKDTLCYWTGDGSNGYELFNICNDYYEAMKVLIDNKIELGFNSLMNKWVATFLFDDAVIMACNENPCRTIAECYLLIKDAEKKDDKKA